MAGVTVIKRSPIIVIRNFAAIELLAFAAYYLVTGHGSYKSQIYSQTFLVNFLSYDTAKLLFLTGVQLLITIYAFLEWYYESYVLRAGFLSHRRGVFFKKENIFPLERTLRAEMIVGFFGKLLRYGSLRLTNQHDTAFFLRTVSHPDIYLKILRKNIDPHAERFAQKPNLDRLIKEEENENLEFKASLRFDRKTRQLNRDLEKAAMKAVAAFLNSKGGYLVIGLDNNRRPLGLSDDYQTLQRKDSDGFENHFTQVFNAMIGPEFRHLIKFWFENRENNDVCIIQIAPSHRPVYLKVNDNEHFFIRTGNITTNLKLSEVEAYARTRWPRRN